MPRKLRKFLKFIIVSAVLIVALLYGLDALWLWKYGSSSQSIPSEILDVDKNFKNFPSGFPPDPGEAGKKTIQGIDSDHDGVRDDVQRWIYAFVPNEPEKQMALRQFARYLQEYLLSDDFNPEVRKRRNVPVDRAVQCMNRTFAKDKYKWSADIYLKAKVLNTYSRVKRYWDNNRKVTTEEMSREYPRYESPCDHR